MMISKILLNILFAGFVGASLVTEAQQSTTPMLSCQPQMLTSKGTLTLRFRFPHPGELAIRAPDGTWFFLVYDQDDASATQLRPLLDKEGFRRLRELTLPAATTLGSAWVAGRDKNELIFSHSGKYEVVLT